jgi:periplasmic protein TonB
MAERKSREIQSPSYGITQKRIILTALLVSVIIHAGILIGSPNIFITGGFRTKLRAFKVDLIRPPMEEIKKQSEESKPPLTEAPTESTHENKEATISLDTTDTRYASYVTMLKERIQQYWSYPMTAREEYMQGDLLIIFRLERNGNLVNSRIARSSGYQILDNESIRAIEMASPFPPFPETIPVEFLNINASFAYQLKFEE